LNLDARKIKIPVRGPGRDFPANCFVARFTQLSNGFWHISSGCQRAGPPVLQKGEQTIANYTHPLAPCQHPNFRLRCRSRVIPSRGTRRFCLRARYPSKARGGARRVPKSRNPSDSHGVIEPALLALNAVREGTAAAK